MIQASKLHANLLNKFIRAYLSNYFNALHSTKLQFPYFGVKKKLLNSNCMIFNLKEIIELWKRVNFFQNSATSLCSKVVCFKMQELLRNLISFWLLKKYLETSNRFKCF